MSGKVYENFNFLPGTSTHSHTAWAITFHLQKVRQMLIVNHLSVLFRPFPSSHDPLSILNFMTTFHRFSNFIPCADIFYLPVSLFSGVHGADIQANKILWTFSCIFLFCFPVLFSYSQFSLANFKFLNLHNNFLPALMPDCIFLIIWYSCDRYWIQEECRNSQEIWQEMSWVPRRILFRISGCLYAFAFALKCRDRKSVV